MIKKNVSLYSLIVKKKFEQFLDDSKKSEKLPTIFQLCQQNANVTLFSFVQVCMNQFYLSGMSPVLELLCSPGYVTFFLLVCADSKFPRSGEERLWSRSQNQQSPWGTQRVIDRYLCSVSPTRSSRGLSTPALNH